MCPAEAWTALGAWQGNSTRSWLLFPRLPCLFGHPPLLCFQPVCCFTLRRRRIASSFVLLFLNIAAVMRHCTTVVCFIILIPVMDLFMQSVEYLCFWWLENDEFYQRGHVYPLDEVYHQKTWLSYILKCTLKEKPDGNNGWNDQMDWYGCLITCKDQGETIKDNHTAVLSPHLTA